MKMPLNIEKMYPTHAEERESGGRSRRWRTHIGAPSGQQQCCGCNGWWIFVVLGGLLVTLGVVCGGVYLHVRTLTTSLEHTEVLLPAYVMVAAVLLTGMLVLLLCWKRVIFLVCLIAVVTVVMAVVSGGTAVLLVTHVLRPMMHFTHCTQSRDQCQCFSPFKRQHLSLEYSEKSLTAYLYTGVETCGQVKGALLHLLFAQCALYLLVAFVCLMLAILTMLAFRSHRQARHSAQSDSYEDIFTVSNSSDSNPITDSDHHHHNHHHPPPPLPHQQHPPTPRSTTTTISTTRHETDTPRREGRTTATSRIPTSPPPSARQLSNTTTATTAREETIANTTSTTNTNNDNIYIYSPADIPVDYLQACQMRQRSHSFSQPLDHHSNDLDLDPAPYATSTLGRGQGRTQGQLEQRRRRERCPRRAMTLGNLEHEQLMLIMSLQLRYLSESESERRNQLNSARLERQSRRALTPPPQPPPPPSQAGVHRSPAPTQVQGSKPFTDDRCWSGSHVTRPVLRPSASDAALGYYENVRSCVQSNHVTRNASNGPSRSVEHTPSSKSRHKSFCGDGVETRSPQGTSRSPRLNGHLTEYEDSGYVVMNATRRSNQEVNKAGGMGSKVTAMTSSWSETGRGASYENVEDLTRVQTSPAAFREPLYENHQGSLQSRNVRRTSTDSRNTSDLSDTTLDRPPRPKSYINAVQGTDASNPDTDEETVTQGHSLHVGDTRMTQSYSGVSRDLVSAENSTPTYATSGSEVQVNACRNGYPSPHRLAGNVGRQWCGSGGGGGGDDDVERGIRTPTASSPFPDQSRRHKSAFHKVSKLPPPPPYSAAPCDTDLDDLDLNLSSRSSSSPRRQQKSSASSVTATVPSSYSSLPSYSDCLISSRHGSLHSLASSSSRTTADDMDFDLYRQIQKKPSRGGGGSSGGGGEGRSVVNGRAMKRDGERQVSPLPHSYPHSYPYTNGHPTPPPPPPSSSQHLFCPSSSSPSSLDPEEHYYSNDPVHQPPTFSQNSSQVRSGQGQPRMYNEEMHRPSPRGSRSSGGRRVEEFCQPSPGGSRSCGGREEEMRRPSPGGSRSCEGRGHRVERFGVACGGGGSYENVDDVCVEGESESDPETAETVI